MRLCVQNRYVGCVLPCTNSSRQPEVPSLCLQEQGVSVSGAYLWSKHSPPPPQIFTPLGLTEAGYLHLQGISVLPYLEDRLVYHPDCQVILCYQNILMGFKDGGLQASCSQIRTGTSSGHPVSGNSITSGSGQSVAPRI